MFGHDFSYVRINADPEGERTAARVGARSVTLVVVTKGAYLALYPDDDITSRYVVINGCRRLAAAANTGGPLAIVVNEDRDAGAQQCPAGCLSDFYDAATALQIDAVDLAQKRHRVVGAEFTRADHSSTVVT